MRHDARWWAKRVEELEAGGDAGVIARRHGVREGTLVWWRSELRRRRGSTGRDVAPRLLPVIVAGESGPGDTDGGAPVELVVEAAGTRVTLRGAISPAFVAALLRLVAPRC